MVSGGEGSAFTAALVADRYGTANLRLLFTDTLAEDTDLYRFLIETVFAIFDRRAPPELVAAARAIPEWHENRFGRRELLRGLATQATAALPNFTWVQVGLDPWEVYKKERFLGNSLRDPCSKILKRIPADRWLATNCDPDRTIVYVGIDWTEVHRFDDGHGHGIRPRQAKAGWVYEAPMCEPPYPTKSDLATWLRGVGVERPRLTKEGFAHNNCSSHCCKAGQGHRARQLRIHPERFAFDSEQEEDVRVYLGRDVTMLTDRSGDGKKKPLTLAALKARIEAGQKVDETEIGGCGCFIDADLEGHREPVDQA